MERHLEEWVLELRTSPVCVGEDARTWADRIEYGGQAVREIVGKVWVYVVLGIAVGSGIHGYVPEGVPASFMGKSAWGSLPLAVLPGVPLYSNAAGIMPVVHALPEKGAAMETALAFMMVVIGLSLPEAAILRKVLKPRLIAVFFLERSPWLGGPGGGCRLELLAVGRSQLRILPAFLLTRPGKTVIESPKKRVGT